MNQFTETNKPKLPFERPGWKQTTEGSVCPQAPLSGLRLGRLGALGQGWVKCQVFGPVAPSPGRLMHSSLEDAIQGTHSCP